ncbi:hypothetical protein AB3X52_06060 [Nocardioides sp. DS6]|uniref:DUF3592 domain-containing protein n=1 Tax=Nocardioides eburneus TaxID=3231482 RepID=A0ABV3SW59_9ACTN
MTATRSGPRVDRAARYGPWIFLIPFLVMTILCGQGVEEYVSDHSPGVPMQQATVRRCEGVHVNGMTTVCATTPDGTNVAFSWGGHLVSPRVGSHIAVFDKNGVWHARDEDGLPIWPLVLGVICAAVSLALISLLIGRFRRWLRGLGRGHR